jgi:hypothetical protein
LEGTAHVPVPVTQDLRKPGPVEIDTDLLDWASFFKYRDMAMTESADTAKLLADRYKTITTGLAEPRTSYIVFRTIGKYATFPQFRGKEYLTNVYIVHELTADAARWVQELNHLLHHATVKNKDLSSLLKFVSSLRDIQQKRV